MILNEKTDGNCDKDRDDYEDLRCHLVSNKKRFKNKY